MRLNIIPGGLQLILLFSGDDHAGLRRPFSNRGDDGGVRPTTLLQDN